MGVSSLWQVLRQHELILELAGLDMVVDIAEKVDQKVVAVDLSVWIMQAQRQQQLATSLGSRSVLKVVFERVCNYLRFGMLPIGVVEGATPDKKTARLDARYKAVTGMERLSGAGTKNHHFLQLGQQAGQLMKALGCPVVQAPGEAEALCAALNHLGYADAVASPDSDSLLFGAEAIFPTLKLQVGNPRDCSLSFLCMAGVRRLLGLQHGGAEALQVFALLAGGDYDLAGAQNVGAILALQTVQALCKGRQDDVGVFDDFQALMKRRPDDGLAALTKCTGCKLCGHDCAPLSTRKHSTRNCCTLCPPSNAPCVERKFSACQCAFHAKTLDRWLDKVVRRAQTAPQYMESARTVHEVYLQQMEAAAAAAKEAMQAQGYQPGQKPTWLCRPNPAAVHQVLLQAHGEDAWQQDTIRRKVLPLLLEWDAAHVRMAASVASKHWKQSHRWQEHGALYWLSWTASVAEDDDREWEVVAVQRMMMHGSENSSKQCWRAVVDWRRREGVDIGQVQADRQWLQEHALKNPDQKSLRLSFLRQHCAGLLQQFDADRAAHKTASVSRKSAALTKAAAAPGQQKLTAMFRKVKQPGAAARSSPLCSAELHGPSSGPALAQRAQATDVPLQSPSKPAVKLAPNEDITPDRHDSVHGASAVPRSVVAAQAGASATAERLTSTGPQTAMALQLASRVMEAGLPGNTGSSTVPGPTIGQTCDASVNAKVQACRARGPAPGSPTGAAEPQQALASEGSGACPAGGSSSPRLLVTPARGEARGAGHVGHQQGPGGDAAGNPSTPRSQGSQSAAESDGSPAKKHRATPAAPRRDRAGQGIAETAFPSSAGFPANELSAVHCEAQLAASYVSLVHASAGADGALPVVEHAGAGNSSTWVVQHHSWAAACVPPAAQEQGAPPTPSTHLGQSAAAEAAKCSGANMATGPGANTAGGQEVDVGACTGLQVAEKPPLLALLHGNSGAMEVQQGTRHSRVPAGQRKKQQRSTAGGKLAREGSGVSGSGVPRAGLAGADPTLQALWQAAPCPAAHVHNTCAAVNPVGLPGACTAGTTAVHAEAGRTVEECSSHVGAVTGSAVDVIDLCTPTPPAKGQPRTTVTVGNECEVVDLSRDT